MSAFFCDPYHVSQLLCSLALSCVPVACPDLVQVWFIVAESIASACFGVARHVGERLTPHEICGSFEKMHKIFFRHVYFRDGMAVYIALVWYECAIHFLP